MIPSKAVQFTDRLEPTTLYWDSVSGEWTEYFCTPLMFIQGSVAIGIEPNAAGLERGYDKAVQAAHDGARQMSERRSEKECWVWDEINQRDLAVYADGKIVK